MVEVATAPRQRTGIAALNRFGLGIAVGIALGAAIGVAMDDMSAGMGVGITLGVAMGLVWQGQKRRGTPEKGKDGSDDPPEG